MKGKLNGVDTQEIIDYYQNHTVNQTKDKWGVSATIIYRLIKKYNLTKHYGRLYFFNESYFEKIDTADKAYFLGWLYSDGNNFLSSGKIQLKIQESDIKILETFCEYTNHDKKSISFVKRSVGKNQRTLRFCSHKMSNDLLKQGIIKAKSLCLEFPNNNQVPEVLIRDFIRGVFDGDGCICKSKETHHFSITGTENILLNIQLILADKVGVKINKLIKQNNVFRLAYGGNKQVYKILSWLYKDCSDLFLERKKEKFEKMKIITKITN